MDKKITAVLFDMDGVLVDSEKYMLLAAKAALKEWGIEASDSDFTEFVGAGEDKCVGGVAAKHGKKYVTEMKDKAYRIYGELVAEAAKNGMPIAFPNASKLIGELKSRGYRVAVCSSADIVKVKINICSLGLGIGTPDGVDIVVSGLDVKRKKPFPDIYLLGAEKLGVKPCECIVAEDAVNGILAAKAANMTGVAVTTSFTREELKKQAEPDYIIDDIAELAEILK